MALHLERLDELRWLIRRTAKPGMLTDAIVFADAALLEAIRKDGSLEQAANVAMLPGIVGPSLAMPDIHQGYGFPIGGVAAMDEELGVVSPGGVGFDINCGVRLLRSHLTVGEVRPRLEPLVERLFRDVPSGTGGQGSFAVPYHELDRILERGARRVVEMGHGTAEDLAHTEEGGCMAGADAAMVSSRAKERGKGQLGTLGSGNHFLEVQLVDEVFDEAAATRLGLAPGTVTLMIHTGSRGLGHQVCTDYVEVMGEAMRRHHIQLPDRQLACAPIRSPEGQRYLAAMAAAANFAWANRQVITDLARDAFAAVLGPEATLAQIYDVAHNIAKRERHVVDGVPRQLLVHRKGATRAFPGQPVLIPGSMGTASYVLLGQEAAMSETWGSACHGAGRSMSRSAAKQRVTAREVQEQLAARGVLVRAQSRDGITEERPEAYKDIDAVVEVVHGAGLATKVARLRPLAVVKG